MIPSRGDPTTSVTRPLSAFLLAIAVAVLVIVFLPAVKKKREEVFVEENSAIVATHPGPGDVRAESSKHRLPRGGVAEPMLEPSGVGGRYCALGHHDDKVRPVFGRGVEVAHHL